MSRDHRPACFEGRGDHWRTTTSPDSNRAVAGATADFRLDSGSGQAGHLVQTFSIGEEVTGSSSARRSKVGSADRPLPHAGGASSSRHLAKELLDLGLQVAQLSVDFGQGARGSVDVEVAGEGDLVADLGLVVVDPGVGDVGSTSRAK